MKTIAFINVKGGVAKTTSSQAVSEILAIHYGKKILAIDLDPQCNLTMALSKMRSSELSNIQLSVSNLILTKPNELNVRDVIIKTPSGIDLIPCSKGLDDANKLTLLDSSSFIQIRLRNHINTISSEYDYCIIDCPTAIKNISTINGLALTDHVLIPIGPDSYSTEGLSDMPAVIDNVQDYTPNITISGIFVTMYQNNNLNRDVMIKLKEIFGDIFYNTHIRSTIKIKEATYSSENLIDYAKGSTAIEDYYDFVNEYLTKNP